MPSSKTDWTRLRTQTEAQIRKAALADPDAQPATAEFWRDARVVMPSAEAKEQISIRLDKDVLNFFRAEGGRGYQRRINTVLRSYMEALQTEKKHKVVS